MSSPVINEPLTGREQDAWRAVLKLADALRGLVVGELTPATGLSAPDYLVLNRLSDAPENRLSGMKSLAVKLNWSASRLSHHLKRMEARGLVERVYEERTGLVTMSVTPRAEQIMQRARTVHAEAVRRYFLSITSDEEQEFLINLVDRVVDAQLNSVQS